MADQGFDLIVDEVIFGEEGLRKYAKALENHRVYFIGVKCDLPVARKLFLNLSKKTRLLKDLIN